MKNIAQATKIFTFALFLFLGISQTASAYGTYPTSVKNPANFHPGYYMLVGYNAGKYDFDMIKDNPDFLGVKKVYIWKNLETAENIYNFSQIEQDLAYLQSIGKRLWLEVQYTEWYGGASARVPSYMWTDSKYGGQAPYYGAYQNPAGGPWYAVIWNANVQGRFAALYSALGKRFNGEPYIEGITLGETSMPTGPSYSATGVENAFKVNALAAKRAFPDKTIIQQINYAAFDLQAFAQWLAGNGIGIGSPDTLLMPEKGQISKVYPLYLPQHDLVPTAPDVQWGNYEHYNSLIGRPNTSAELLDGGVKATNPWYYFWVNREPYFTRDAVPAIRAYGQLPAAAQFYAGTVVPPPTSGYTAQYWNIPNTTSSPTFPATVPTLTRTDADINFFWGTSTPATIITPDHFAA
ncbi:MAG: hypothetical protein UY07_C0052G0001, partial [Parcubacteria group bacterium GW2011_GWA1_47_8]